MNDVDFRSLGRIDYMVAWELQQQLHRDRVAGERPDTVLLLEHPSVYTAGKRTRPENRPTDGIPVIDVDRGGDIVSARQVGVPVFKVRVALFMVMSASGWLVGMLQLFAVSTVQATTGLGQEFTYVICAVVGGCLLTGGYGSAIGAAVGALIYGMTLQGIVFAQWDNNWLKAFLGALLLIAVLVNLYVRRRAGDRT